MNFTQRTQRVREEALRLGFDACGFAKAGRLEQEERRLEEWLNQGRHGNMSWMENYFDKRVDPTKLVPGAKSVVSVMGSYYHPDHERQIEQNGSPKISKYAQGRDYHKVYKQKLKKLFQFTRNLVGNLSGRVFVDSAPVLDKAWAKRAGIGWIGKNSNLLNKDIGSFTFIGEMIVDAEFVYSTTATDHCGSCTRCIDACPTNAIYEPYRVDGSKCISYFTIELKEQIPEEYRDSIGDWLYGCDICQDVCPWNREASYSQMEDLAPRDKILNHDINFWEELDLDQYDALFEGSAIRRARFEKFKMNAITVSNNLSNHQKETQLNEHR
ncbi:tRNA epoxyqueuosine(34) reductase QueG [Aliifodinibius sp. S!AR15-10]|uniref:tRNA epoxyqueuosine(34) reductase QueG n=1 Tax=Aliifodinibius sp. S!AR15-10 TaxID=2950437 RepID=UPI0028597135|nr:tRNA epoxyqueuosine(34) reductase QueG [Aliifodinibius sp. S!AR15-10]MDR8392564.1 tRNA epoxyqueuosine(34) reductase QueG [Aliifodinibius sp. S!AR15-10]